MVASTPETRDELKQMAHAIYERGYNHGYTNGIFTGILGSILVGLATALILQDRQVSSFRNLHT